MIYSGLRRQAASMLSSACFARAGSPLTRCMQGSGKEGENFCMRNSSLTV